jgi:hypothetical protein
LPTGSTPKLGTPPSSAAPSTLGITRPRRLPCFPACSWPENEMKPRQAELRVTISTLVGRHHRHHSRPVTAKLFGNAVPSPPPTSSVIESVRAGRIVFKQNNQSTPICWPQGNALT